jgi:glycosyltransferase involved in cell wall biosynthesis
MAEAPRTPIRTSVVIPVHNEEDMVADTCSGVLAAMTDWDGGVEIVLVENGSSDRTWEIVAELQRTHPEVRALQEEMADYGNAVRAGLRAAAGEWAVVFDCDLWDESFARSAVDVLENDPRCAVVVASKTHPESSDDRSPFRRAGTRVFTFVVRSLCGLQVSDTHGMKVVALNRSAEQLAACRLVGHVFDTELILRLERAGFTAGELPCRVRELRPARSSYLSRVPSALSDVWRLRRMLAREARAPRRR